MTEKPDNTELQCITNKLMHEALLVRKMLTAELKIRQTCRTCQDHSYFYRADVDVMLNRAYSVIHVPYSFADDLCPADAMGNALWPRGSLSLKTMRMLEREEHFACSPVVHAHEIPGPTIAEIAIDEGPSTSFDPSVSLPSLDALSARTSTSCHPGNTASSKKEVGSS